MIHLRVDDEELNANARFACGIGWPLPDGDKYVNESEYALFHMVTCEGCGGEERQIGTPISELSGQPGTPGYEKFKAIARSWGYD